MIYIWIIVLLTSGIFLGLFLAKREGYSFDKHHIFLLYLSLLGVSIFFSINPLLCFLIGLLGIQFYLDIQQKELANNISFFALLLVFVGIFMNPNPLNILKACLYSSVFYIAFYLITGTKGIGGGDVKISFIFGLFGTSYFLRILVTTLFLYIVYYFAKRLLCFITRRNFDKNVEYFPSMFFTFLLYSIII